MRYQVRYEFSAEVEDEHGDIVDSWFFETLAEALATAATADAGRGEKINVCLVRDEGNDIDGLVDRQWAYVDTDGYLPSHFDGGAAVPQKFKPKKEGATR